MALQPGDRFGRYELMSWLGRGGMAETWRARWMGDAGVTKSVLIKKVLPEFVADDAFVSMFVNEARISATLSHGNIAQVFDFGRVDEQYYLAMELVDGAPLHRIMKRAAQTGLPRLPVPIATYIALEMCRGLHYAHTRTDDKGVPLGIVHRDISPDNVLVSYEGQVKIVDFGIAKARMARNFQTEPGVVKGKYLFFSPEQARGREVDARTDVWATGLVLYEMLCGQTPVSGSQAAVMMKMANGEFPSPREVYPGLPEELDDIVMKALSVDLSARYESANAFADALAGFLYSYSPRFSTMNLAYLARVLFRGDMAQEGRELSVPPSFIDELTLWREQAERPTQVPPARGLALAAIEVSPPVVDKQPVAPTGHRASSTSRGMLVGAAVVVGAILGGIYWSSGEPLSQSSEAQVNSSYPIPGQMGDTLPGAEEALRTAQRALDSGDFRSAVDFAEQCLGIVPDHSQCLLISGASLARDGRFTEAVHQYQRFVHRHPRHGFVPTVRTLIEEYTRRGAEEQSVQPAGGDAATPPGSAPSPSEAPPGFKVIYDKETPALVKSAESPVVRDVIREARGLMGARKYRDAIGVAEWCAKLEPSNAECRLVLGDIYVQLKISEFAAHNYRRFLELAPNNEARRPRVTKWLKRYDSNRKP
ncbi:serine/threonine protein kinase [Myxococcus fulvus 124B02]|nr:serine/threonine protein kinase [Myxococcus fulvus 124B02]